MGDEHNFLASMIDPGGARAKHGVGYFDEVDAEAMIEEYEEAAATAGRLMAENAVLKARVAMLEARLNANYLIDAVKAMSDEEAADYERLLQLDAEEPVRYKPHPDDEADCAEGMRMYKRAHEAIDGDPEALRDCAIAILDGRG